LPDFIKIGQAAAEILRFKGFFKMAAVGHLGFSKFEFLTAGWLVDAICGIVPYFVKIGQTVAEIAQFTSFFKMPALCQIEFSKIKNYNHVEFKGPICFTV